jgi:predicted esterase
MRYACAVVICLLCWGCGSTEVTTIERSRQSVFTSWENLDRQELMRNYSTLCNVVDTILVESNALPRRERQWNHAIGYFIRARAEARLDRPLDARRHILLALDAGYRNDAIMESDSVLIRSIGKRWFDSVITVWGDIQREKRTHWTAQNAIVLTPKKQFEHKPIIIALHGGNSSYEEFASHFLAVPDELHAVLAFPTGPIKYSAICHAWPKESIASDSVIFAAIDSAKQVPGTDTSRLVILGYSQGAATAIGFSLRHPRLVSSVISFSGFNSETVSDSMLSEARRDSLKFYAISGTTDAPQFLSTLHLLSAHAKKIGLQFYFEERVGMMHGVPLHADKEVLKAWNWLHEKSTSVDDD